MSTESSRELYIFHEKVTNMKLEMRMNNVSDDRTECTN